MVAWENIRVKEMKTNARELALEALISIEKEGAYSNLLINQLLAKHKDIDGRDRALFTEIVYGTIQHQRWIDFHLAPFLSKGKKLDSWVKQLLRLSVYQFLFLDRVPSRAVVHESVEIAKRRGHRGISGMVNGVLRNFLRSEKPSLEEITDTVERLAIHTSHPTWLVQRWVRQYGWDVAQRICAENNLPAKVTVRVNTLKASRAEVIERLAVEGFKLEEIEELDSGLRLVEGQGNLAHTKAYQEGLFTIQGESSMHITPLLDPKPGMKVLDACAAPGGKTTHIAEYMQNEGRIIANDLHVHKERLIQEQVQRLGISNVETMVRDARRLPEQFQAEFDRILIDAPCSGFGVIRRKPDLKWSKTEKDIGQIAAVQKEILEALAPLLKKGGSLVYSTCTMEEEENDAVIQTFLENHPSFKQVEGSTKQILPHDYHSDGFYMTKIERVD